MQVRQLIQQTMQDLSTNVHINFVESHKRKKIIINLDCKLNESRLQTSAITFYDFKPSSLPRLQTSCSIFTP